MTARGPVGIHTAGSGTEGHHVGLDTYRKASSGGSRAHTSTSTAPDHLSAQCSFSTGWVQNREDRLVPKPLPVYRNLGVVGLSHIVLNWLDLGGKLRAGADSWPRKLQMFPVVLRDQPRSAWLTPSGLLLSR